MAESKGQGEKTSLSVVSRHRDVFILNTYGLIIKSELFSQETSFQMIVVFGLLSNLNNWSIIYHCKL